MADFITKNDGIEEISKNSTQKVLRLFQTYAVNILKSGKIFNCFAFAYSSPRCDMWLSCLSRANTPHLSRFSKLTWYILLIYKLIHIDILIYLVYEFHRHIAKC